MNSTKTDLQLDESTGDTEQSETRESHISPRNPVGDLLAEEAMVSFAGLTPQDDREYPKDVSTDGAYFSDTPRSFKAVIALLPNASEGELWATNDFVDTTGTVDLDAIRDIDGLDTPTLESLTGVSLSELAAGANAEPVVRVRDHKDIVDDRRKALNALGYDVGFRWQIASDSYTIINPHEAYLPIISALQQRGEDDAFGWASYRDWGGLLKMVVICPSLRHTINPEPEVLEDTTDEEEPTTATQRLAPAEPEDGSETVVYGGFQTGYDFRGTQTLWARPIIFFPESGTVLPDTGERYTRRHYGKATDAAHERKHGRVPINEWWRSIYDDIDTRMVEVEVAIRRTRAIAYDFEALPFSLEECYTYWGVAAKYAERAAERASSLAIPATRPTVFNLQLSLLIALLEEYDGSMASDSYHQYLETAGELFRKPAMMIQLAVQEHDRQVDDEAERVLLDGQQTLSDALEDIVDIPGISVESEVDLSDQDAQRVQDRVQQRLDETH